MWTASSRSSGSVTARTRSISAGSERLYLIDEYADQRFVFLFKQQIYALKYLIH